MLKKRHYTWQDSACLGLDQMVRTLFGQPKNSGRPYPVINRNEETLTATQHQKSAALMRINHAGEVCAQALYHGQGCISKRAAIKEKMALAALEEGDHLVWCQKRLTELGSRPSYLNVFWYTHSFVIGMAAGLMGDKWSLGFLAETEEQVVKHLTKHLVQLQDYDKRSYQILLQMQQDEAHHREDAIKAGGNALPKWVKKIMQFTSKIMVKTTYWI